MMNDTDFSAHEGDFRYLEAFEAAQNWSEFDCTRCNDTGYDYDDEGEKVACTCDAGRAFAFSEPDCDDWDDESAFTSAGWGDDDSYNYDDWN